MDEIRIGSALPQLSPSGPKAAAQDKGFGDVLKDAVAEVNRLQTEADQAVEGLVTEKQPSLHGTLVALEKADISFKLMMKVRDKIVDAYREVMRMSV
jgi:flagellar hook-basal body complex protein FliE